MALSIPIPEDFGAVGNGATDDTTAMNSWKAAGKMLGLKPGSRYRITSTLVFGGVSTLKSVRVLGNGVGDTVNSGSAGAQILWGGASGGTVVRFSSTQGCVVEGLQINGNSTAGIGLEFTAVNAVGSANFCAFRDISIHDVLGSPGYALHVGSATNDDIANNIFHNIQTFNSVYGLFQDGGQTAEIFYQRCHWAGFSQFGMHFANGEVRVRDCGFATSASGAIDDVYVNNNCGICYVEGNYHEIRNDLGRTTAGHAYNFPTGSRAYPTSLKSIRILWALAGGDVINYAQAGPVLMETCQFDNFGYGGTGTGSVRFTGATGPKAVAIACHLTSTFTLRGCGFPMS